jgi:hypothetical protein
MTEKPAEKLSEHALAVIRPGEYFVSLRSMAEVQVACDAFAQSGFYKGLDSRAKVFATMQLAHDNNVPFSLIAMNIAFINGRASMYGDALIGIAHASHMMQDFEETIEGEGEAMQATCRLKRKGVKTEFVRTFSIGDAKLAGLLGKGPWQSYPKRMLQMRARSWALRDAGLVQGIISAEEAQDIPPAPVLQDTGGKPTPFGFKQAKVVDAEVVQPPIVAPEPTPEAPKPPVEDPKPTPLNLSTAPVNEDESRERVRAMLLAMNGGDAEKAQAHLFAITTFKSTKKGEEGKTIPGVQSVAALKAKRLEVTYGKVHGAYDEFMKAAKPEPKPKGERVCPECGNVLGEEEELVDGKCSSCRSFDQKETRANEEVTETVEEQDTIPF